MSTVLDAPDTSAEADLTSPAGRTGGTGALVWVARTLPWLIVAAVTVVGLLWSNTPATDIARYAAYWAGCVVLPGTLIFRALRGSRGNLPEDIGFGAITGLVAELPMWALGVGTGQQHWLWAWPIPVVALFAGVPRLRRFWRIEEPRPLPIAFSWSVAGIMSLMVGWFAVVFWGNNPLPPATHSLFEDLYYHWANSAELSRTITPQQPQMAGVALHYHWFSDAHRATAHLISGVPISTVLLRLWWAPVVLAGVLVICGLARQVTGAWWSGPLAASAAMLFSDTVIWPRFSSYPVRLLASYSPTLTYSIPVLVVTASLLVDVARGKRMGRAWVLVPVFLLASAGSKSSSIPVLLCGVVTAAGAAWMIHRRPPKGLLVALAATVGVLALAAPIIAGGLPGSGLQLGAAFTFKAQYINVIGSSSIPGTGGFLPPSLQTVGSLTKLFFPLLIVSFLISQLPRLLGLVALLRPRIRRDPAAWLLAGTSVGGLGAALLVSHVANGELYFWYSAVAAGSVLGAWLIVDLAPARQRRIFVIGGLVAGGLLAKVLYSYGPGGRGSWKHDWAYLLGAPLVSLIAILGLGALAWRVLPRLTPRASVLTGKGAVVMVTCLFGLGFFSAGYEIYYTVKPAVQGHGPSAGSKGSFWVTAEEMRAAQWLAANAPANDVVATNIHCENLVTEPNCINRSFWVSGLTEHRVVLEGWAYQEATQAAHGKDGLPYFKQPAPDLERLSINDQVFTNPTAEVVGRLQQQYGAHWLYADDRAGAVSPDLTKYAQVRYHEGTVTVYELTGA
ncbi:hypothetical protein [Hamadaea tsunoensis]|uniref:hypothetical protein n=1 Tax=Hamadaea tsunoensis TaxID=53368 RepID=UPI0004272988|nr:hypothetical protein [Hamadaea tsunoensis]